MARQSSPSSPLPVPPPEALPDLETVGYLKKFKTSLCKRWSYTKADSLWEMSDLAMFLWALERYTAALAIAQSVTQAVPSPPQLKGGRFNFNLWSPATKQHALIVHLAPPDWQSVINDSRTALLNEPGFARDNPSFLDSQVHDAKTILATPVGVETQKWECLGLARSLAVMNLFLELARGGDDLFKPYESDADKLIPQLLPKLGSRLMDKK